MAALKQAKLGGEITSSTHVVEKQSAPSVVSQLQTAPKHSGSCDDTTMLPAPQSPALHQSQQSRRLSLHLTWSQDFDPSTEIIPGNSNISALQLQYAFRALNTMFDGSYLLAECARPATHRLGQHLCDPGEHSGVDIVRPCSRRRDRAAAAKVRRPLPPEQHSQLCACGNRSSTCFHICRGTMQA